MSENLRTKRIPGETFQVDQKSPNWDFTGRVGSDGYDRIKASRKRGAPRQTPLWAAVTAKRLGVKLKTGS